MIDHHDPEVSCWPLLFVAMILNPMLFSFSTVCFLCVYCNKYSQFCQPQGGTILEFCQSFSVHMRPVGRRSGGTWVPLCGSFVVAQNVGDEIRIHVHVVAHHRWRFPELTQNPTDFGNLGSFIRQALLHLACNFFCVQSVFYVHSRSFVSHACIISDGWFCVKGNQGFFLLPIYIIGILCPLSPPLFSPFSNFAKVVVSHW